MEITMIKKIKNFISGHISILASVMISLILAGCSGATNYMDSDSHKRNEVEMVRIPFTVTFEAGSPNLSGKMTEELDIFMMKSNVSYGDELSMDFPLQRDGKLSKQNETRLASLSALLKKRGLRLSTDITPYGLSPRENQARLLISRYVVTPPRCGDWSQPSNKNYGNSSLLNLGCANQANLGLMVANPRDLIIGTNNGSPDAEKSAKAVNTYRTKKPANGTSNASKAK